MTGTLTLPGDAAAMAALGQLGTQGVIAVCLALVVWAEARLLPIVRQAIDAARADLASVKTELSAARADLSSLVRRAAGLLLLAGVVAGCGPDPRPLARSARRGAGLLRRATVAAVASNAVSVARAWDALDGELSAIGGE